MAQKFLLATSDYQYSMVSSWRDEIYCSILKDGTLSLRARKDGDEASVLSPMSLIPFVAR